MRAASLPFFASSYMLYTWPSTALRLGMGPLQAGGRGVQATRGERCQRRRRGPLRVQNMPASGSESGGPSGGERGTASEIRCMHILRHGLPGSRLLVTAHNTPAPATDVGVCKTRT